MTYKPKLFIGSAAESIDLASAVHNGLYRHAEVSPWYSNTFKGMNYPMEDLEEKLNVCDFAVFILSPDDVRISREKTVLAPRDNTLFELGLFWGKLKRGRVFLIKPQSVKKVLGDEEIDQFHILSDMNGLTLLEYETDREDNDYNVSVSMACMEIVKKIQNEGVYKDPSSSLMDVEREQEIDGSILEFLTSFSKGILEKPSEKYHYLSDSIRNEFRIVDNYKITGVDIWKENEKEQGLQQVAGNKEKDKFYSFSETDNILIEAYQNKLQRIVRYNDIFFKQYRVIYSVGNDLLVVIYLSGRIEMSEEVSLLQLEKNQKLFSTINYLLGGDLN